MTLRDRSGTGSSISELGSLHRFVQSLLLPCWSSASSQLREDQLPLSRQGLSFFSPSFSLFGLAFREPPHSEEKVSIYPILELSELPGKAEQHRGAFLKRSQHQRRGALGRGNSNPPSVAIQPLPVTLHWNECCFLSVA